MTTAAVIIAAVSWAVAIALIVCAEPIDRWRRRIGRFDRSFEQGEQGAFERAIKDAADEGAEILRADRAHRGSWSGRNREYFEFFGLVLLLVGCAPAESQETAQRAELLDALIAHERNVLVALNRVEAQACRMVFTDFRRGR